MERLSSKVNGEIVLNEMSLTPKNIESLTKKIYEYENELELIKKNESMSYNGLFTYKETMINSILNDIYSLTKTEYIDIKELLLEYCTEEGFEEDYDCLFWSNEGYDSKFKNDVSIVKLIDSFFVCYRLLYFPNIKHRYYSLVENGECNRTSYKTRYEYLITKDNEMK